MVAFLRLPPSKLRPLLAATSGLSIRGRESGDVVSVKLQEDGTSGTDAAVFTTAALPADASAAQIVTSLNSANAVVGVSSVEDLISTDVLEFVVTSADGQEYTFNNVATYAVDGTTPATLTSLGDAETLADVVAD